MSKRENTAERRMTRDEVLGRDPSTVMVLILNIGLLCIGVATLIPLLNGGFDHPWFRYLYAAGAVMVIIARLFSPYTGRHLRMKRLHRMEAWSSLFFGVAVFFMFYDKTQNRDWLAFTMAGAVIQVVATMLMVRVARKALR